MTTNSKSKSVIVELKALLEDDEDRLCTLFHTTGYYQYRWTVIRSCSLRALARS